MGLGGRGEKGGRGGRGEGRSKPSSSQETSLRFGVWVCSPSLLPSLAGNLGSGEVARGEESRGCTGGRKKKWRIEKIKNERTLVKNEKKKRKMYKKNEK